MEDQAIIILENVTKKIKKTTLLDSINLTIYKGQSVALVGHNGVGKSTLLKIIAGLCTLTAGKVIYNKKLLFQYVPEQFPRNQLTVVEYLDLISRIDGFEKKERQKLIDTFLADFFMTSMANTPLQYLSKGSLQKVGVIQALLTTPDVLLLDEPLSGQDAKSQRAFINQLKALLADGTTIIMSCHEKYLIHEISDTIVEIHAGHIQLTQPQKTKTSNEFTLTFRDILGDAILPALDFPVDQLENSLSLTVDETYIDELIELMMKHGWSLRGLEHV